MSQQISIWNRMLCPNGRISNADWRMLSSPAKVVSELALQRNDLLDICHKVMILALSLLSVTSVSPSLLLFTPHPLHIFFCLDCPKPWPSFYFFTSMSALKVFNHLLIWIKMMKRHLPSQCFIRIILTEHLDQLHQTCLKKLLSHSRCSKKSLRFQIFSFCSTADCDIDFFDLFVWHFVVDIVTMIQCQ